MSNRNINLAEPNNNSLEGMQQQHQKQQLTKQNEQKNYMKSTKHPIYSVVDVVLY